MRATGEEAEFDPAEVVGWFHNGTDALRVIALNLMLVNEDYRDFVAVLETVDTPHSLFEQFYGLKLAEAMLPGLDSLQGRLLSDALSRARRRRRFRRDLPRRSSARASSTASTRGREVSGTSAWVESVVCAYQAETAWYRLATILG